jgi:hypothetical protein
LLQPQEEAAAPLPALEMVEVTPAVILPAAAPPQAQPQPPQARPAPPAPAADAFCGLNAPNTPRSLGGATIVGFFTPQQSLALFQNRAGMRGGEPSPAYRNHLWVRIHPDRAPPSAVRGTVLPAGMKVAIGDHVVFDSAYRDPAQPCHFVPSLITVNEGPVARPVAIGPGVEVVQ